MKTKRKKAKIKKKAKKQLKRIKIDFSKLKSIKIEKIKSTDHPILWVLFISSLFALCAISFIFGVIGLFFLTVYCIQLSAFLKEKRMFELERQLFSKSDESDESEIKAQKQIDKIQKIACLYKSIKSYIDNFGASEFSKVELKKIQQMIDEIGIEDLMNPTVEIKLHNADIKDLRKKYREINKDIETVLNDYEKRYTTKGNLAIYRLMVVALRSELQNVLYTMKYGKLQDAEDMISEITDKYIKIAADGNQSIAPTIVRFVSQTKSLFLDAVRVEYEYYLRKERIKEEQKALREQMRQEAEEQRRLEEEKKKIEAEEAKYTDEMEKLMQNMKDASEEKTKVYAERIAELESLLNKVNDQKETIVKLQNGKAGYVYVISNLGSFGDHVFKIGMTRRKEPQERIDELGDASVPFGFDVHSFIFSEDAASLETAIHHKLNEKRVNKVNLRKEFFDISIDELEALVYDLDPSAEFNRTMAAEQYRQSLSMTTVFEALEEDFDE